MTLGEAEILRIACSLSGDGCTFARRDLDERDIRRLLRTGMIERAAPGRYRATAAGRALALASEVQS
jgi:hypothetical protein